MSDSLLKPCPIPRCKGKADATYPMEGRADWVGCSASGCPLNSAPMPQYAWQLLPRPSADAKEIAEELAGLASEMRNNNEPGWAKEMDALAGKVENCGIPQKQPDPVIAELADDLDVTPRELIEHAHESVGVPQKQGATDEINRCCSMCSTSQGPQYCASCMDVHFVAQERFKAEELERKFGVEQEAHRTKRYVVIPRLEKRIETLGQMIETGQVQLDAASARIKELESKLDYPHEEITEMRTERDSAVVRQGEMELRNRVLVEKLKDMTGRRDDYRHQSMTYSKRAWDEESKKADAIKQRDSFSAEVERLKGRDSMGELKAKVFAAEALADRATSATVRVEAEVEELETAVRSMAETCADEKCYGSKEARAKVEELEKQIKFHTCPAPIGGHGVDRQPEVDELKEAVEKAEHDHMLTSNSYKHRVRMASEAETRAEHAEDLIKVQKDLFFRKLRETRADNRRLREGIDQLLKRLEPCGGFISADLRALLDAKPEECDCGINHQDDIEKHYCDRLPAPAPDDSLSRAREAANEWCTLDAINHIIDHLETPK